jgi:pteridine reductase
MLSERGALVWNIDKHLSPDAWHYVTHLTADVRDASQLKRALEKIPSPIHVLINNAGVMRRGKLLDSSETDFDLLFDMHVKAPWMLCKLALPRLARNATILHVATRNVDTPSRSAPLYKLSKFAGAGFAKILASEHPKLRVKIAYPGPVDTPLARHGLRGKTLKAKQKLFDKPDIVAEQMLRLIESDATTLHYNDTTRKYRLV